MLRAAPGCSCAEPGSSSPVERSALVSERQCLIQFSLPWEKQPTLEIKPCAGPRSASATCPGLLASLLRYRGCQICQEKLRHPPLPPTRQAPRSHPRPLFTHGCSGTALGTPRAPDATTCPCHHVTSRLPSQLGSSLRGEKSGGGRHPPDPLQPLRRGLTAGRARGRVPAPRGRARRAPAGWRRTRPCC